MISLQISMNMEMNPTTQMEVPTSEDLQWERGVKAGIVINPVYHMQEVMQQMSMRTNPKAKQGIEVTIKREVQEETWDLHTKMNMNQNGGKNYPVDYAKNLHIQTYLGVQILKSIYQVIQRIPKVFPKKYAKIA